MDPLASPRPTPPVTRLMLALALAVLAPAASAQATAGDPSPGGPPRERPADVRLDVERLVVDSLAVTADSVRARLDLDASVGGLLTIRAGLTVEVDGARVEAGGVGAVADLQIQLDAVAEVLREALRVIRENPGLVRDAVPAAGAAPPRGQGP